MAAFADFRDGLSNLKRTTKLHGFPVCAIIKFRQEIAELDLCNFSAERIDRLRAQALHHEDAAERPSP
jgi:hypothetical protein